MRKILFLFLLLAGCAPQPTYDLVIRGGRVMDPASGLDAVRDIGIVDGRIEAISEATLQGERMLDAEGLVVAPGFVDLHVHGHNDESYAAMVQDGVTSGFELEAGTGDVEDWYSSREGGKLINYGVGIGHIPVRMIVMEDQGQFLPSGPGGSEPASAEQLEEIARRIREGLEQGAVAVGFGLAYTPAASTEEFESVLRIAEEFDASAHIHVRGGVEGAEEAIEAAKKTSTALHIVHANSSGAERTEAFMQTIQDAVDAGQDVTTEAYPYEAGMTRIESALFDDWESYPDDRFGIYQWGTTGERLTRESFARYREQGGSVIIHSRTEAMTDAAIEHPLAMIASDGSIVGGSGHPRTAGTYSKVLGKYVREKGAMSLMEALRKMTIEPARRLEQRVPAMAKKGRIEVGADADIVVFDPDEVIDRATYTEPALPSEGIQHVLVNGVPVVENGVLSTEVLPGRAIRAGD